MSAPMSDRADSLACALETLGVGGEGSAASAWREAARDNSLIARHIAEIARAVEAAEDRASTALSRYVQDAPPQEEFDSAQRELLDAAKSDDPERLRKAEERTGELLARKRTAEEDYTSSSKQNLKDLAADKESSEQALPGPTMAMLDQALASLAPPPGPGPTPPAPSPLPPVPSPAPVPSPGAWPNEGHAHELGGWKRGDEEELGGTGEPGTTHVAGGSSPEQPATLTVAPGEGGGSQSTPVAVNNGPFGGPGPRGEGAPGGATAPMVPGMGGGGPRTSRSVPQTGSPTKNGKPDGLLNGDDLIKRTANGTV